MAQDPSSSVVQRLQKVRPPGLEAHVQGFQSFGDNDTFSLGDRRSEAPLTELGNLGQMLLLKRVPHVRGGFIAPQDLGELDQNPPVPPHHHVQTSSAPAKISGSSQATAF